LIPADREGLASDQNDAEETEGHPDLDHSRQRLCQPDGRHQGSDQRLAAREHGCKPGRHTASAQEHTAEPHSGEGEADGDQAQRTARSCHCFGLGGSPDNGWDRQQNQSGEERAQRGEQERWRIGQPDGDEGKADCPQQGNDWRPHKDGEPVISHV
jgi:hypothetical protein